MASLASHRIHYPKPWKAHVKLRGKDRFLGYFATREEAVAVENRFRREKGLAERDGRFVIHPTPTVDSSAEELARERALSDRLADVLRSQPHTSRAIQRALAAYYASRQNMTPGHRAATLGGIDHRGGDSDSDK